MTLESETLKKRVRMTISAHALRSVEHRGGLDAIQRREGARAEGLMREHARIAHANLHHAMADHRTWLQVPGASLVRRRVSR